MERKGKKLSRVSRSREEREEKTLLKVVWMMVWRGSDSKEKAEKTLQGIEKNTARVLASR